MLSGVTASALAMAGTAVFRIVVSSDSMKKATATSHGNNRFTDSPGAAGGAEIRLELAGLILVTDGIGGLGDLAYGASGGVAPHFELRISAMSSPYVSMYCLCSTSLPRF